MSFQPGATKRRKARGMLGIKCGVCQNRQGMGVRLLVSPNARFPQNRRRVEDVLTSRVAGRYVVRRLYLLK